MAHVEQDMITLPYHLILRFLNYVCVDRLSCFMFCFLPGFFIIVIWLLVGFVGIKESVGLSEMCLH